MSPLQKKRQPNPVQRAEMDHLLQKVKNLTRQKPEKAGGIVTRWLNQSSKASKAPTKKSA